MYKYLSFRMYGVVFSLLSTPSSPFFGVMREQVLQFLLFFVFNLENVSSLSLHVDLIFLSCVPMQVTLVKSNISQIGFDIESIREMITGLVSILMLFVF